MATVIYRVGSVGTVTVEADYDDANPTPRIQIIRVINPEADACFVQATRTSNGRTYGQRFGPGTTFITIPQSPPASRLEGFLDARGRLDGIDWSIIAPYP